MAAPKNKKRTTVGEISADALVFTAGKDAELDLALVEADCLGSAAHATMLSRMPVGTRPLSAAECKRVIKQLVGIMRQARKGAFRISTADQDVHLAVERVLTRKLGDLGKKIHTGRSRNDQVAVDLRLYAKQHILETTREAATLATALLAVADRHAAVPMVGRTHMQPAMPSSVGLWASAHAESLLDDIVVLMDAYALNDQCPLGSAAGYGVPLPVNRALVSDLLGFSRPCHNVLYASNARGKLEALILSAMSQVMLTLSRLAQDLILYSMPEFGYFRLPAEYGTGSSIMPQKNNPDVLELIRAKSSRVAASALGVYEIVRGLPSGYNRDVQETKEPLMEGIATTRSCLCIMLPLVKKLKINKKALLAGFTPSVFATDYALQLVSKGMAFRDAYRNVKEHLEELDQVDPHQAIAAKTSLGATAGLALPALEQRAKQATGWVLEEERAFNKAISRLLGVSYPLRG